MPATNFFFRANACVIKIFSNQNCSSLLITHVDVCKLKRGFVSQEMNHRFAKVPVNDEVVKLSSMRRARSMWNYLMITLTKKPF